VPAAAGGPSDSMHSDASRPGPAESVARRTESFGKDRRILRRADYLGTYATGRRHVGRWLVLFVRPGKGATVRLGVTITKKTGSAVVRNRLRRRLRELFRRSGGLEGPLDVVVNVRAGAETTTFAELASDFERVARRARAGGVA